MKPRIQGKIRNLPPKQRQWVDEMLRQNLTYAEIKGRLKQRLRLKIGDASLSRYYKAHASEFVSSTAAGAEKASEFVRSTTAGAEKHGSEDARPLFSIHLHFHSSTPTARQKGRAR